MYCFPLTLLSALGYIAANIKIACKHSLLPKKRNLLTSRMSASEVRNSRRRKPERPYKKVLFFYEADEGAEAEADEVGGYDACSCGGGENKACDNSDKKAENGKEGRTDNDGAVGFKDSHCAEGGEDNET